MHIDILIRAHLAHAQKNKKMFLPWAKIGEGGDDKQVINLIWPKIRFRVSKATKTKSLVELPRRVQFHFHFVSNIIGQLIIGAVNNNVYQTWRQW